MFHRFTEYKPPKMLHKRLDWMTMFHRSAKPASLGSTHETAAAPKLRLTELIKLTLQCNIGIWPSQNSRSGL